MAKTKTINGVTYTIPETGEDGWGANVTAYLEAIADGGIFTGSGSVTLSQDLNLGNTAGIIVKYVKSNSSNIADSGIIRLANGDDIAWRNNANGANLVLEVNASDKLTFNSKEVLVTDNSATVTNKSIDSDNNTITNIVNADIKAAAAIDATKIADGSVTSTEFQYISTLSSNAQTQITANASNIATNTSNISTNTANITSNDTDIAARLKKDGSEAMTGDLDLGSNNLVTTGNVDGRDVSADGTKLDGIEALADVTDATNVAAAGALMKSGGTMTGNIDMGSHNIVTTGNVDGRDLNTDGTKLDGIEAAADVTDATNVAAAGALMKSGGTMTGNIDMGSHNIVTTGNVDGRDLNTDGTKLDGIEASADVTDATNVAAAGALMKSGGTMTGNLDMGSHNIVTTGNVDGRDLNTDGTKLDGIEASADVTDATNVAAAGAVMAATTTTSGIGFVVDEDDMSSDSATKVPTQQSVKKYVDDNAGGGESGKNYVLNPDAAEGVTNVTNVCTGAGSWSVAQSTTASELPEPSVGTGFKISGTNVAVNDTVKWDILTTNIDDADGGRMGTAEMYVKDISGTISGDYKMQVYNVTTSSYVGDSVDIDGTGYFFVDVPLIAENDYQVHLIALITSPTNIGISGVSLGPVSNSKSAVVTAWKTYTPSSTPGWGTITNRLQWRQVGESIEIAGNFTSGTVTGDEARIALPNDYTVDFKTPTTNIHIGDMVKSSTTTFRRNFVLAEDGQTYIKFAKVLDGASANPLSADVGTTFSSSYVWSVRCSVPVLELKNSTTLDISDVQFANARFSATQLTTKSTSNGVITDIDTWTSSTVEGGGSFNGTTYTIPADGWYEVRAMIRWANATFGSDPSNIYVYKNTTAVNISYDSHDGSANNPSQSTTFVGKFAKDDTVKIACKQNSGTIGLGTTAGEALFSVVRVSDTSARNAGVSLATTTVPGLLEYKVIETTDDATYSPHSAYQKLATHTLTKGTWEVCSTVLINAGISGAVTMYAVISPNASSPATATSPYPSLQGKQFGASVSTPTTTITVTAATENWYLYFWAGDTSDTDQCMYHFHCRKIAD